MGTDAQIEAIAAKIAIQKIRGHDRPEASGPPADEGKVFARHSAILRPAGGHARRQQTPEEREAIITAALTDPDLDS
jgi:hypothetical protein